MPQSARKTNIKQARRGLYQTLLIEAGEKVFARDGYGNAKVQDIAQLAGLSLGTFYSVFDSKDDLFNAIHEVRGQELAALAQAEVTMGRPAVVNLFLGIAAYFRYFTAHRDYLRMHVNVGSAWALETGLETPAQMQVWRQGLAMMAQVIEQAMADGDMLAEDATTMARMLSATHQVRLDRWLESNEPTPALLSRVLGFMAQAYLTDRGRKKIAPILQAITANK